MKQGDEEQPRKTWLESYGTHLCMGVVLALWFVTVMGHLPPPVNKEEGTALRASLAIVGAFKKPVLFFVLDLPLRMLSTSSEFVYAVADTMDLRWHDCANVDAFHDIIGNVVVWAEYNNPEVGLFLRTTATPAYLLYEVPLIKERLREMVGDDWEVMDPMTPTNDAYWNARCHHTSLYFNLLLTFIFLIAFMSAVFG